MDDSKTANLIAKVPLTREFLLSRGRCCHSGCLNCPYNWWDEEWFKEWERLAGCVNPP